MKLLNILACCSLLLLYSCGQREQKYSPEIMHAALEEGNFIAKESFKALSGELKQKVAEGGIAAAIDYCHLKAYPLTDSLSKEFMVHIKRSSFKLRNPANAPDSLEAIVLKEYEELLNNGEDIQPIVEQDGKAIRYFAPIVLNAPLCLNCHGEVGKFINENDYALIKAAYPSDKAIDYELGQLRGIWSIEFPGDEFEASPGH